MITQPGWYMYFGRGNLYIFQVFEHNSEQYYWTCNTLFSVPESEYSLGDNDHFIYDESELADCAYPLLEYNNKRKLFNEIFNNADRYVMGRDYK